MDQTGDRPPDNEYLECAGSAEVSIRMHVDAIDGIARDVMEGVRALPKRGAEIGGLLLGKSVQGEGFELAVERYQRIECEYRFGPQFVLDTSEIQNIEQIAGELSADSGNEENLEVIGYYRSNTRTSFDIEASDREIVDRYFPDPGDLTLLIQPVNARELHAQFFVRDDASQWRKCGEEFPFRGRVLGPMAPMEPYPAPGPEPVPAPEAEAPLAASSSVEPERVHPERPRRLVPDFMPPGESPRPVAPPSEASASAGAPSADPPDEPSLLSRWWPLAAALLLVGGGLYFLFQSRQSERKDEAVPPAQTQTAAVVRPLGLYVDPSGDTWRISWNASASALQNARNVALFVRESEDQNRIELAPQDLQSGTYQYQPKETAGPSRDVTFRLEVTDSAGQLAAESFRLMRTASASPQQAPAPVAPRPSPAHPKALKKVPPVVPAGIRPRIRRAIPIDVRVTIDSQGRVVSAVPLTKTRDGLHALLATRAVIAAKQWRFEPAAGTEVIHFVFDR